MVNDMNKISLKKLKRFIYDNHKDMSVKEMASALGTTVDRIYAVRRMLVDNDLITVAGYTRTGEYSKLANVRGYTIHEIINSSDIDGCKANELYNNFMLDMTYRLLDIYKSNKYGKRSAIARYMVRRDIYAGPQAFVLMLKNIPNIKVYTNRNRKTTHAYIALIEYLKDSNTEISSIDEYIYDSVKPIYRLSYRSPNYQKLCSIFAKRIVEYYTIYKDKHET